MSSNFKNALTEVRCKTIKGTTILFKALHSHGSPVQMVGNQRKVFVTTALPAEIDKIAKDLKVGTWTAYREEDPNVRNIR